MPTVWRFISSIECEICRKPPPLPTDSPRVAKLGDVGVPFPDAKSTCDDGL
jgi:hypothetical protein